MKDILKYIVPYFLLIIVIFISNRLEIDRELILPTSMAILAVYYLRIDNPHKTFLNLFSILLILSFAAGLAPQYGYSLMTAKVLAAITVLVYILRFLKREEKLWIDYLKVVCILLGSILLYLFPKAFPPSIFVFASIYFLDRFIIRQQMKKTTQIIIFSMLALVSITFVIYGQIKANDAMMNAEAAKSAQEEAMQMADMARQQAEDAAAHAFRNEAKLTELRAELVDCKGK